MTLPRVVFLSDPPIGIEMVEWLRKQNCYLLLAWMDNFSVDWDLWDWKEHPYDLGLNFLGSSKVPPEHCNKFVNFHPAPLPEFAGRNVAYHAIKQGVLSFGATCHYMTEEYDAGGIIEVMRYPVEKSDTAGDLVRKSRQCCVDLFKKWVPELLKGKVASYPQDKNRRRYYYREEISDRVTIATYQEREILAKTCPPHQPYVVAGGKKYKLAPMEENNG